MSLHHCHQCGMDFEPECGTCPKCDFGVYDQNKALTYTRDIAHDRQTVDQAITQFYATLNAARKENYGSVRLIVGGGKIKEEIGALLETEKWSGGIQRFELEQPNTGAYFIKLG